MASSPRKRPIILVVILLLIKSAAQPEFADDGNSDLAGRLVDTVLEPFTPYRMQVAIGAAKFIRFTCLGGPADVVISLATYSENADPLLLMSMGISDSPSWHRHDASSFLHWREDSRGAHFIVAKAVGPEGGIIALLNTQHFAAEELDGELSLRCSFIISFDFLFWNHLHDVSVCPTGVVLGASENHFCSGHGQCSRDGMCLCDPMFAGPACEYKQNHVTVASYGQYDVDVQTGTYHYIRVRVPPNFEGGYLEVKLKSNAPLVLLMSQTGVPTKSQYEMSNFDDWIRGSNISLVYFPVESDLSLDTIAQQTQQQRLPHNRRMQNQSSCPKLVSLNLNDPACRSVHFQKCEGSCTFCMSCNRMSAGDGGCTSACHHCTSSHCLKLMSACCRNSSCALECESKHGGCLGKDSLECESKCGGCLACIDSSDEKCKDCPSCCGLCLPLAAKCGHLRLPMQAPMQASGMRVVTVGVFHHSGRNKSAITFANAQLEITLRTDSRYGGAPVQSDFLANLYDPFHDIRSVAVTQRQVYPDGSRFFYPISLKKEKQQRWVRVFNSRMTLLQISHLKIEKDQAADIEIDLSIDSSINISHVLATSSRAPKTLFDFDKVVMPSVSGKILVHTVGESVLWCAIFAKADAMVHITITSFTKPIAGSQGILLTFACACGLALALIVCVCLVAHPTGLPGANRGGSNIASASRGETFSDFTRFRSHSADETAYLTAQSSELKDRQMEEEYLNRSGIGDDGI